MEIFEYLKRYQYEELVLCHDAHSGLNGIIAIHDTTLGPALGGTRMWKYETETEAIFDALRLARGMTYKAAVAGLDLGGGKGVIMADPLTEKTEALWRSYGRYVESLKGRFYTAEDVGTTVDDIDTVALETSYVTGTSGENSSGDPSPVTAFGVWKGIEACLDEVYGSQDLSGKVVAIQGLGSVGRSLASYLAQEGASLVVTDIDSSKVKGIVEKYGAQAVEPKEIYGVACHLFAPCALGAVINDETLPRLRCDIIAGAANNILAEEHHGQEMEKKGILYAPDYVINAGGLINVADELNGYQRERAMNKAARIYDSLKRVFARAREKKIPTYQAADGVARERLQQIAGIKRNFIPS